MGGFFRRICVEISTLVSGPLRRYLPGGYGHAPGDLIRTADPLYPWLIEQWISTSKVVHVPVDGGWESPVASAS